MDQGHHATTRRSYEAADRAGRSCAATLTWKTPRHKSQRTFVTPAPRRTCSAAVHAKHWTWNPPAAEHTSVVINPLTADRVALCGGRRRARVLLRARKTRDRAGIDSGEVPQAVFRRPWVRECTRWTAVLSKRSHRGGTSQFLHSTQAYSRTWADFLQRIFKVR